MDKEQLEKVQRLAAEVDNFRECYAGNELWGEVETFVSAETLILFLIEHPELPQIADEIERLKI